MTAVAPGGRRGFTLVELLVVVALMIVLMGLALAVANTGAFGSQRVVSAGDRVSGWLLVSRALAMRDGAPRGVRFIGTVSGPDPRGTYVEFKEAQYIETTEPWVPNPDQELNPYGARIVLAYPLAPQKATDPTPPASYTQLQEKRVYLVAYDPTYPPTPASNQNNARGQLLMQDFDQRVTNAPPNSALLTLPELGGSFRVATATIPGGPRPFRLSMVTNPVAGNDPANPVVAVPASNFREMVLTAPPDLAAGHSPTIVGAAGNAGLVEATYQTYKFGFQSAPRPLLGEPLLQLTGSTCIDYRRPAYSPGNPALPAPPAGLPQPFYGNSPFGAFPAGSLDNGFTGYRDYRTPTPPAGSGPYHPRTTLGVQAVQDAAVATAIGSANAGWYFDVVFAPTGQVLGNPNGLVCLWIRDPSKLESFAGNHPRQVDANTIDTKSGPNGRYDAAGEQTLVTVYTRSGLISTVPVNPPPAVQPSPELATFDPYLFAKDGINSGL